jgi:hypothetical protein
LLNFLKKQVGQNTISLNALLDNTQVQVPKCITQNKRRDLLQFSYANTSSHVSIQNTQGTKDDRQQHSNIPKENKVCACSTLLLDYDFMLYTLNYEIM